jgi:transcriptional regulator with XRE-family HTH domain
MAAEMMYAPTVDDNAAKVVRSLLSWHGLTQADVADTTGLSEDTLGRRLSTKGKVGRDFKAHEVELLAWYFGRPVSEFYTGRVNLVESYLPGDERRPDPWTHSTCNAPSVILEAAAA